MFRERRIVTRCRVEFERLDRHIVGESEDLHVGGVFVRTDELLPVGAVTQLQITLPDGTVVQVVSRVAHQLDSAAARALGRAIGVGFTFLEHETEGRDRLIDYLENLEEEEASAPDRELPEGAYILVADPSEPMRERLVSALSRAEKLHVVAVSTGAEAYAACREVSPHAVVAEVDMPEMDGWSLLQSLGSRSRLARIPVVLLSEDGGDLTRLKAYRLGVSDFIPKPFTDEELRIRVRRVLARQGSGERTVLRGKLSEIPLSTLLSILDFEAKSGILELLSWGMTSRVFVARGRVVRIEGPVEKESPRRRLLRVLDWSEGDFEFHACEVVGTDEIQLQTTQLLLEHARVRDEEEKRRAAPPAEKDEEETR